MLSGPTFLSLTDICKNNVPLEKLVVEYVGSLAEKVPFASFWLHASFRAKQNSVISGNLNITSNLVFQYLKEMYAVFRWNSLYGFGYETSIFSTKLNLGILLNGEYLKACATSTNASGKLCILGYPFIQLTRLD